MNYLLHNDIFLFGLILVLQVNAPAHAQQRATQESSFVQLNVAPEFSITPGKQKYISLSFFIKEGYHIQAHQVKHENLIPTKLNMDTSDVVIFGNPIFPEAVEFRMKGSDEVLQVYRDTLVIDVPIMSVKSVEKEKFPINAKLFYQACDNSKCYFPRELFFIMKLIDKAVDNG